MLTQKGFAKEVRDRAVIWINPAKVTQYSSSKWPVTHDRIKRANARFPNFLVDIFRPTFRKYEPFLTPAALFYITGHIDDAQKFQLVEDFIAHKDIPENSVWFKGLLHQLEIKGTIQHKDIKMHSREDIEQFFANYVQPLIADLGTNGYIADHTGFESTAVIASDGTLIKSGSGNHRFYICKVLGVARFQLRIVGMHEDVFAAKHPDKSVTAQTVLKVLKTVEAQYQ